MSKKYLYEHLQDLQCAWERIAWSALTPLTWVVQGLLTNVVKIERWLHDD